MNNYRFSTAEELKKLIKNSDLTFPELVIQREVEVSGVTVEQIRDEVKSRIEIMLRSIDEGLLKEKRSVSGLCGGEAKFLAGKRNEERFLSDITYEALIYSFAVMENNASFGKIVACPTAGSSGIVPGVLLAAQKKLKKSSDELVDAYLVASGIGVIAAEQAMIAGAAGGCQAEVGTATAMAAGALTYMRDGDENQIFDAAGICFKVMLGLVCDPVAGLVECPCVKRNASGVMNAFMASELVVKGIKSNIPFDEVLLAVKEVGESMDEKYRETALGGIAATKTGKAVEKRIFQDN